jgi:hypothetical protein
MKRMRARNGQALVFVVLSLGAVFGLLALGVDLGWTYFRREAAQSAADAAATAVVRAALNSSPAGFSCSSNKVWCGASATAITACPATAPTSVSSSYDNGCMMASANGFVNAGRQAVTLQAYTSSTVPTVSGPAAAYWAVARVSEKPPTFFGSLAGSAMTITARATAMIYSSSNGNAGCIYVLDPTANNAFLAANNAQIVSACGVYVNSSANTSSTEAMYVTGSAKVTAPTISVVGSVKTDNNGSTSITPATGATAVADPFASLPSMTPSSTCTSGNFTSWQSTAYTPSPGTYCNGFYVGNGMNAVMTAGTYIISGGQFSIQGGSTVTATGGVTIYLTGGATVNIANGTTVTLSAANSGTYQGILFYQDRSIASPGTSYFAGGTKMNLSGSLYFPNALVNIDNGSAANVMAIVAGRVNFQGGATIKAATSVSQTGLGGTTYKMAMVE